MDRLGNPIHGDAAAQSAVDSVNAAIEAVDTEAKAIEVESKALVEDALSADPSTAERLARAVAKLRVRRLANIMTELGIPQLKEAAEKAVRAAAVTAAAAAAAELADREKELNAAADQLGLAKDAMQRTQLIRSDKARNLAVGREKDCRSLASAYRGVTEADAAAVDALRAAVTQALTV
ncbi:MAG: hypothetical protein WCK89_06075 [bacterium]